MKRVGVRQRRGEEGGEEGLTLTSLINVALVLRGWEGEVLVASRK